MNKIAQFLIAMVLLCQCNGGKFPQNTRLNLDFETRSHDTSLPNNWYTGGEGFKISLDSHEKHNGKLSLKMEMHGNRNNRFGVFTGMLPIEIFAGKRV